MSVQDTAPAQHIHIDETVTAAPVAAGAYKARKRPLKHLGRKPFVVRKLSFRTSPGQATAGRKRSVAKTLSWRALASIDTFLIAWLTTGEIRTGAFIVGTEVFTKMFLYYMHERGWARVRWGIK